MTNAPEEALPTEGLVCVVGAGGKKTTLYTLANRLDRAVVTATVRIPIFDDHVARVVVDGDAVAALERHAADADIGVDWPLGLVPEQERDDRYLGYDPSVVDDLAGAHDGPVLVKADGARMREFKAPDDREPQIPDGADAVVPIASAHVVGEPLTDTRVHRPERVAAIAGIDEGDEVTADAVGRVLASPEGGLKDVSADAEAVALVNKVDDADDEAVGREIARAAFDADGPGRLDRVVLAALGEGRIVDVIDP
ncbi:selenium cofactor biosynthesis protein YqeC [Halobaculum magnesiiphilum]|uniref:Putative selenium-dependent hydroxylase accessory protein YqeC n=1 Tax=Halobaculum magnesiiphilum TaxID=1017351 RepID=A0A8T8WGE9_9EURY|nr:selenium cofactor biosynthesis protein YqeC [Halobaculum magnesiiphilum]QZP38939.1 putative selenium-dependent hydroxylase accessory protein YqeC [Halobaculum magnesiiphilum]